MAMFSPAHQIDEQEVVWGCGEARHYLVPLGIRAPATSRCVCNHLQQQQCTVPTWDSQVQHCWSSNACVLHQRGTQGLPGGMDKAFVRFAMVSNHGNLTAPASTIACLA